MPKWRWVMAQLTRRLWVRASLLGVLGILAAMLAAVAERYIPWTIPGSIGADAVDSLLAIIASSMLSVTTFSLSVMVSAYGSATSNVTPRATKLLIEDPLTQTVLATFIGSFLFSIVGLIVLKTGAYGDRGRVVLFVVTIAVIALVVVSLLRWIDHLTRLGRVGETTDRVEEATRRAITARLRAGCLGGRPWLEPEEPLPSGALAIIADRIGYILHIDMPALARLCEDRDTDMVLKAVPGTFVYPHVPLAFILNPGKAEEADALRAAVCAAFSLGDERSFDQDPRFGLAVMSEIGCRALSPGVNDAGTAIDVIGRVTRLLSLWAGGRDETAADAPDYPRIQVPPLQAADLFEDSFMLMARDGAGLIEVQLRLQKSLLALSRMGDPAFKAAARFQSRMALDRAEAAMVLEADKARLRELVRSHTDPPPATSM